MESLGRRYRCGYLDVDGSKAALFTERCLGEIGCDGNDWMELSPYRVH